MERSNAPYADCKTCRKLMRNKSSKKWIISFCIATIVAIIFMFLYFAEGNIGGTIELNNIDITTDGGNVNNNNINSNGSTVSGKIETKTDIGVYIILAVVFGSTILIGGYIYCNKNRSQNNN